MDVNTSLPLRWSDGTFNVVNARFMDMAVSRTLRVLLAKDVDYLAGS